MMGKDVERMVAGVDGVKSAAMAAITSFAESTAYQLISREGHAGTAFGPCRPEEIEVPAENPMAGISATSASLSDDYGKMSSLERSLFTSSNSWNNSIGSPWNELNKLQEAVDAGNAYAGAHAPFNYVGEKAGMLAILNMILQCAIDAKAAITSYHDYVQRGYDNNYNSREPSITFQTGLDKVTNGNLKQTYNENVNIKAPSIDPF